MEDDKDENDSVNMRSAFFVLAIILGLIILSSCVIKPALVKDDRAPSTFFQDTKGEDYWEEIVK